MFTTWRNLPLSKGPLEVSYIFFLTSKLENVKEVLSDMTREIHLQTVSSLLFHINLAERFWRAHTGTITGYVQHTTHILSHMVIMS